MEIKVTVKENDQADRARFVIGSDEGSVTIEGSGAFVTQVFTDLINHEGSLLQSAIFEGIGEFESKEQIESLFSSALADKGKTHSLSV